MKELFLIISILLSLVGAKAQDHILLQFRSEADIPAALFSETQKMYTLSGSDPKLMGILNAAGITIFNKEYPNASKVDHPKAARLGLIYRIKSSGSIADLYNKLQALNSSALDRKIYLVNKPEMLVLPNDYNLVCFNPVCIPRCSNLQNDLVNAPAAWDITTGNPAIRIAMTDVNFRRTHEELAGKVVVDNAYPFDIFDLDHGLGTATMAAGNTNNGAGIASVGYNCKLDLYDAYSYDNILLAAQNGAKVVNCSWLTSCSPIPSEQDVIDIVYDLYHTVIVGAAGNTNCGQEGDVYPASYNHVISVTAVGHIYTLAELLTCGINTYSVKDVHTLRPLNPSVGTTFTHNPNVDLCAPGYLVTTSKITADNAYGGYYGTSYSAPMVAGAAALILSVNSSLLPDDVEAILKCSARDVYEIPYNISYLNKLGSGRIDVGNAVLLAQTWTPGSGGTQQTAPTDIRWFNILSDGVNTVEVEDECALGNYPGMCNIGYRLEVVSGNPSLTFKWLNFYSESGVNVTNSIKYGNSITLTRGIDYPYINNSAGSLKICVRVNECVPSIYYSEDRVSDCLGLQCNTPCLSDITITGNYSTPLTESATWIKSSAQTTISASVIVKLDAHPVNGYVELKPVSNSDFVLAQPDINGTFIVQAYNGCVSGTPSLTGTGSSNFNLKNVPEMNNQNGSFSVYPNPATSMITLTHPSKLSQIEILDIRGKVMLRLVNRGSLKTNIDLSSLPAGIYIIRTDKVNYVSKVIKL